MTIKGKEVHGGGQRVRFKYPDYTVLIPKLYVAVTAFTCDITSKPPTNLRIMGDVARHEYECFASFVEAFGHLPEFNDMKLSPKK